MSIAKLKAIHTATHRAATIEGPLRGEVNPELEVAEAGGSEDDVLAPLIEADEDDREA